MLKRWTELLMTIVLFASCQKFAEGRQMFRELMALHDQIATEFHEKDVDVNLVNGKHLVVKFINSPINARSSEEKQQRADAVATFVAAHYKRKLQAVSTQFVTRAGAGGFSVASTEMYVGHQAAAK
jgi:hypothetical protein